MYRNLNKKKRVTKQFKILKIDVHGKVIKKRRLLSSFFFLYSHLILQQFLQLNYIFFNAKNRFKFKSFFSNFLDKFVSYRNVYGALFENNDNIRKDSYSIYEYNIISRNKFITQSPRFKNNLISFSLYYRYKNLAKSGENKAEKKALSKYFVKKLFFNLYFSVTKPQYLSYLKKAFGKKGTYVDNFFNLIESRIDMFVYRAFSNLSNEYIKQLILHKKVYVNGKRITHSSYIIKKNDIISFFNIDSMYDYYNFAYMYKYMLAQMIHLNNNSFIFKYPEYMLVDYNFLLVYYVNDKFLSMEIPNFFKFDFKSFSKIRFI